MNEPQEWTPDTSGPDSSERLLSAQEAAASLAVHERTIRRAIARGTLPATKRSGVWRIDPDDLAAFTPGQRSHIARARQVRAAISLVPPAPPFLVPLPRTPLIGREREIATVCALILDDRAPLVTLTGPGGSGKTRLALAIAGSLRDRFADGIWFVDLSALRDADLVPGAIVQSLELREVAGEIPFDRIQGYFQARTALLVLDNVEQVATAAVAIGHLLAACPGFQVLATSRVPLHVSMEHQVRAAPLDLPNSNRQAGREEVETASATRLFRQAAQRVRSDFQITDANAPAIAALCTRLDGLPLAIELAAAQSGLYAPETLLDRLDQRLDVLDHGPHDAPPRLRSMHDAIGWSYDLLDEHLQERFRRLSVFDGGFTAAAAAIVTSRLPLDPESTDDHLRALVDANLVVAGPETSRFTMLETIREFAMEQLEQSDEAISVRDAHARWCLDLLTRARLHWFCPTQTEWGDRVEQEHANLRAALTWLDASTREAGLVALAGLMWPFWFVRHHWVEGKRWLDRAVAWSDGWDGISRLRILVGASCLTLMTGHIPDSVSLCRQAFDASHGIGEMEPIDTPFNGMAIASNLEGNTDEGDRWNTVALEWFLDRADRYPASRPMAGIILNNMGWNLFADRRIDEAIACADRALTLQREAGCGWVAAETLFLLARIAEFTGRHQVATAHYHESLHLAVRHRQIEVTVNIIDRAAAFLATSRRFDHVAILLGASARLHELVADVQSDELQTELAYLASRTRAHLGDDAFDRLYRHGQAMSLEEVMAVGLEASVPPSPGSAPRAAARWGITMRESEVLNLLSQGLTDQEIAVALFISRRTANSHVANLLAKLQVPNRRQAVSLARTHGLLGVATDTEGMSPTE